MTTAYRELGKSTARKDGPEKVTGGAEYTVDVGPSRDAVGQGAPQSLPPRPHRQH